MFHVLAQAPKTNQELVDSQLAQTSMEEEADILALLGTNSSPHIIRPLGYIAHQLPSVRPLPCARPEQQLWQMGPFQPRVTHLALELCRGGSLSHALQ